MRAFDEALNVLNEYPRDEKAVGSAAGCYYHLGILAEVGGDLAKAREYFLRKQII